jgi:hypothetical protein
MRARWIAGAALLVLLIVVATYGLKYRSWPLVQPPEQVSWCGTTWERENAPVDTPDRLYSVARQPPLVGLEMYSPYTAAERHRLSTANMGSPCGGVLLARNDAQLIAYVAPG